MLSLMMVTRGRGCEEKGSRSEYTGRGFVWIEKKEEKSVGGVSGGSARCSTFSSLSMFYVVMHPLGVYFVFFLGIKAKSQLYKELLASSPPVDLPAHSLVLRLVRCPGGMIRGP